MDPNMSSFDQDHHICIIFTLSYFWSSFPITKHLSKLLWNMSRITIFYRSKLQHEDQNKKASNSLNMISKPLNSSTRMARLDS